MGNGRPFVSLQNACFSVLLSVVVLLGRTWANFENVARGKDCIITSVWNGTPDNMFSVEPNDHDLAVNGLTHGNQNSNNCINTGYEDRNCYWEVDLGQSYPIHYMINYGRNAFAYRMSYVVVTVDGMGCYTFSSSVSNRRTQFSCSNGVINGTRVRLSRTRPNGEYQLNLCEFQVFTCKGGYWGSDCKTPCGQCSGGAVCDRATGVCQGCEPGWKETVPIYCNQMCDDGWYGQGCASPCNARCSDVCDKVSGQCTCSPGWSPPFCSTMCPDDTYGQDCLLSCGQGCANTCNKVNGICSCSPGWQPPLCNQGCVGGQYGQNCTQTCSAHCTNLCDRFTGNCTCKPGYQPPLCKLECVAGKYGQDCLKNCSKNCDSVCDSVTGQCTCKPGWQGPLCDLKCPEGTYGQDCSQSCGNCGEGSTCHHVTGRCSVCNKFFALPFCTECVDYTFGLKCDQNCSIHCRDVCDKVQGHCTCRPGWQSPDCVQECTNGTYGLQCASPCGNCSAGNTSCHYVTGHCPGGCLPGFAEPLCQNAVEKLINDDGGGGNTGAIIGAVIGVIVVIIVVSVVIVIIRRRRGLISRSENSEDPKNTSPTSFNSSSTTNSGSCNNSNNNSSNSSGKNNNNSSSSSETKNNMTKGNKKEMKEKQSSFSDVIYQNVSSEQEGELDSEDKGENKPKPACKPVIAAKPKLKTSQQTPTYVNLNATHQNLNAASENLNDSSGGAKRPPTPTSDTDDADEESSCYEIHDFDDTYMALEGVQLSLDAVQQYLLDRLRTEELDQEFGKLDKGLTRDHVAGSADENYCKNRFLSVLPYDDNRVVLHDAPHQGATDYINASYIKGWDSEKAYIACQGPRANTLEDMWWMMWQEHISHIVMLTNTVEVDRKKCDKYWPVLGTGRKYGSVYVKCLDEQTRADYVIRKFDVRAEGVAGPSRKVTQYHFVTWLDHDVHTVTSLVDFWNSVNWSYRRQQTPTAPLVVHCSGGVGRTGIFIGLDSLAQQLLHSNTVVNVQQTVQQLRHDRCQMIQTKGQYQLLYEAVLEAYSSGQCRLSEKSLESMIPAHPDTSHEYIDGQFQKLQQTMMLLTKPSHKMAEDNENISKNRDFRVLPDDNHAVHLTYPIRGRNQYINAVFTSTFFRRRGCILTQLPLTDTVIDLWRLIAGKDVTTIVSLGSDEDTPEGEGIYWPTEDGQRMTYGPFTITLSSRVDLGHCLTSYTLHVLPEVGELREVSVLHYRAWKGQLPDNMTDLLQLLSLLTDQDAQNLQGPPVVLQCRDGASRSGLLRVIADVINRMTSDGQVDMYTAVKHIQNVRPECVNTVEQYRYIYQVAQYHHQSSDVYQNT